MHVRWGLIDYWPQCAAGSKTHNRCVVVLIHERQSWGMSITVFMVIYFVHSCKGDVTKSDVTTLIFQKMSMIWIHRYDYFKVIKRHVFNISTPCFMMTSSNGNIFRVTGPLWGEAIDRRSIPITHKGQWHVAFIFFICIWKAVEYMM